MLKEKLTDLIGNTPLLELKNIEKKYNLKAKLIAKLEYFNPSGSSKDRVAYSMIKNAKQEGLIDNKTTIIEPTSGNTGIGLAAICASMGLEAIFTMPETMSVERIKLLSAYGAKIVLTEGSKGMKGAIDKANEIHNEIKNSFIPSQFDNPNNPKIHFETTGKEIYDDLDGKIDIFIAGVGTGGTISGVGKYLKSKNNNIKIVALEPYSSPVLTKGISGAHKIQGIGANFIPKTFDKNVIDEIITIKDEDAFEFAKICARTEGILVGISSGCAIKAGIELAKKEENKNKTIVVLLPDSGEKYLSTGIYD